MSWRQRLTRVFHIDIEHCGVGGATLRVIACIETPEVIERILTHLAARDTGAINHPRAPGLTIHVRHGEEYREESASRAFPGWRAEEIHRALTEAPMSEGAWRALERTALAMGSREGTTPEW